MQGVARNTGGPSRQPESGQGGSYKPKAKSGAVERESEGTVVPQRAVGQNAAGGKGGVPAVVRPTVEVSVRAWPAGPDPTTRMSASSWTKCENSNGGCGRQPSERWRYDWVIDMDNLGLFDNLDHSLTMRAVARYTQSRWILLYVKRWLEAPVQQEDGTLAERTKGTPQGGVASPLLANIFLHLAFDEWMRREYPEVPFERCADDIVAHCDTEQQAHRVLASIEGRLKQCRLELNRQKTRIVYCKDDDRRGSYIHTKFDFLGYTFQARRSKNRWGKYYVNFSPAVSGEAATRMRQEMRQWKVHVRSDKAIDDLARMWNPVLHGWIRYYGRFYKSALSPVFRHFNTTLVRWAMRKYKRLRRHRRRAEYWLGGVARREPRLFAHWNRLGMRPTAG